MTTNHPPINHLLDLLLRHAHDHALILTDPKRRIVGWLAGSQHVFGYAREEVVGKDIAMLFTPEDLEKEIPRWEHEVASGLGVAENDRWMMRKDGLRMWVTGTLVALREEGGRLVGFGKILRNRTDLKGQIERIERENTSLKESEKRKNTFISTLAHELRNPLAAMLNAVEFLRMTTPASEESGFGLTAINRQLQHMRALVDELMDVTRISVGKVLLRKELVELRDVVKAAVETSRAFVDERTHHLEMVLTGAPVHVNADAMRLQQVFVNLLQNAAKYTEYGGQIWVKLMVEGNEAVVRVADTGVGISADMLPRIFDLFTQAEFASEQKGDGLGIGLSVVRNLVTLHGGSVQVHSDGIGKGSEFTVRLPLAGMDQNRPDTPLEMRDAYEAGLP